MFICVYLFQLQLSDVIMQTRHYMMDMVGGHGTLLNDKFE